MRSRVTRLTLVGACVAALLALPASGSAARNVEVEARGDGVTITQVDSSQWPTVRVAFGADNDKSGDTPALTFFENGEPVNGATMFRGKLGSYDEKRPAHLIIAFDSSLSMEIGTRFVDAKRAAREMLSHARKDDQIGLVTFGGTAKVLVKPTTNHDQVAEAIEGIKLEYKTAMYDGVSAAAGAFDEDAQANRAIVLLSDGTDLGSKGTLEDAASDATRIQAPVFAVAIAEDETAQPKDMAALGNGTGGELRTIAAANTAQLDAVFDDLGRRLLQPYWVEYQSSAPKRSLASFGIGAGDDARRPSATMDYRAMAAGSATGRVERIKDAPPPAKPIFNIPGGALGLLLCAFPFGLLLFWLSLNWLEKRSTPDVVARINRYTEKAEVASVRVRKDEEMSMTRRLGGPLVSIGDTFMGKSAFFERTRLRAEQAAIAIKPSELFALMVVFAGIGFLVALMVGMAFLMVMLPVVFGFLPNVWLRMKARKRRNTFDDQLPDILQGIASSLKAGHSFNQAINAMVKDAPQPTSEEFSRVMTEARLGMPIEMALQHMADRMGSPDFDFAVTTVNIQRSVGGSLAEILEMVGDTVRNRQQFRKKVKALVSMGQASAYVLLAMPFVLALLLTLINREFMEPLYTTTMGHLMMVGGGISMTFGYFACMKIVDVKS